jgi:primosomal protein N' (replication factor Y)
MFFIEVVLPLPLRTILTYLPVPHTTRADYVIGARVLVPFGRQKDRVGFIVGLVDEPGYAAHKLKPIQQCIDRENVLTDPVYRLAVWASQYYQHGLGEVLAACLPVGLRQGVALDQHQSAQITLNAEVGFVQKKVVLTPAQKELIALLDAKAVGMTETALWHLGIKKTTIKSLLAKGWLHRQALAPAVGLPTDRLPTAGILMKSPALAASAAQQRAIDQIHHAIGQNRFSAWLLYGITGSGKTEVYLQSIAPVLAAGKQVLILVPEIALTPQTVGRFADRFYVQISVLHSKRGDGDRVQDYWSARRGEASIVIGTRSAVFTPMRDLGLIIVDEEHDLSFKQQEGFRYSGRDLAVIRANQAQIPIVLGSATPALESIHNVMRQRYGLLTLADRAGQAALARLELLPIGRGQLKGGVSEPLIARIQSVLDAGQQVLLFLNRRGFAPVLLCHGCGWGARCTRCEVYLTVHKQAGYLLCHYCGQTEPFSADCPTCGAGDLETYGVGTEQMEHALQKQFPKTTIVRVDRDTTRTLGSLHAHLAQVHQSGPLILIGTQMLAKGHHFPGVILVGMVDVDGGLFSSDFRAPERMLQQLIQVAGRAGRGDVAGTVVIQTRQPDHPLLQGFLRQSYWEMAVSLLAVRQQACLPPFWFWCLVRAESPVLDKTMDFLAKVKAFGLEQVSAHHREDQITLLGPVSAPHTKKAGVYRGQLLIQSAARQPLQSFLKQWIAAIDRLGAYQIRWSVDVDPLEMG